MQKQERKVVVISAGFVGTTYIYALMHTGLASEITLIDLDQKRLKGEVMDLEHGLAFVQPGYTFSFNEDKGYEGLIVEKPLLVVYARGGEYLAGTESEAFDLQIKYIELIFKFIGFEDIRSVVIEPTLQGGPDVAKAKLYEAVAKAKEIVMDF